MIINQKKDGSKYKRSNLEAKFERMWTAEFSKLHLEVECALVPKRRFRCDYTHHQTKTCIEIQGGLYQTVSGHSSLSGKLADAEKSNLLVLEGYRLFTLWTSQVTKESVLMIGSFITKEMR